MKKLIRVIQIVVIVVIIFSSYRIYSYYQTNKEHDKKQEELINVSKKWEEEALEDEVKPTEDEVAASRISHLQIEYPSIIGWTKIPGTNIDYPFVQGSDNEYYLDHDFKGDYDVFGAVFMEKDNNLDFSDQNTILYGHNIRTGKFFHELLNYRKEGFVEENPIIEISHLDGFNRYEIFAVYAADPMEKFRTPNYSEEELNELMERIKSKNEIHKEIPEDFSEILTLQTCLDNDVRLVVHGKKIK